MKLVVLAILALVAVALLAFTVISPAEGDVSESPPAESNLRANAEVKDRDLAMAIDPQALNAVIGGNSAGAIDPKGLNAIIEEKNARDLEVSVGPAKKPPAVITGDPHFTMFSGRKFDFHGGCDLVFLNNPDYNDGQGMVIHVRTKISTWWSYVQSAVVQIGEDTLEVMGGFEAKQYWVNDQPGPKVVDSSVMPFTIGGHSVRFRVRSDTQFQFKIFLENDQSIILRSVKDFMKVDIEHHTKETFGTSRGLLGSYEDGQMLARDGVTVLNDANQFGMEWQVNEYEPKLFHSVDGPQRPDSCAMPTETQFQRRLGEQLISREAAARACIRVEPADLDDCITDVMATGDEAMAGAF